MELLGPYLEAMHAQGFLQESHGILVRQGRVLGDDIAHRLLRIVWRVGRLLRVAMACEVEQQAIVAVVLPVSVLDDEILVGMRQFGAVRISYHLDLETPFMQGRLHRGKVVLHPRQPGPSAAVVADPNQKSVAGAVAEHLPPLLVLHQHHAARCAWGLAYPHQQEQA